MRGRLKLFLPLLAFILLGIFLARGLYNDPSVLPSALIGDPFPEFELNTLEDDQRVLRKSDLPREPILINVWATWCYACRIEHPMLRQLAERGIKIIGINYKDERDAALQWLRENGNPYQFNLFDLRGSLGLDLGVYGAPETYLVDSAGTVLYRRVGVIDERVWDEEFAPLFQKLAGSGSEGGQ